MVHEENPKPHIHTIHLGINCEGQLGIIEVNHDYIYSCGDTHWFCDEPQDEQERILNMSVREFIQEYMNFHEASIMDQ